MGGKRVRDGETVAIFLDFNSRVNSAVPFLNHSASMAIMNSVKKIFLLSLLILATFLWAKVNNGPHSCSL